MSKKLKQQVKILLPGIYGWNCLMREFFKEYLGGGMGEDLGGGMSDEDLVIRLKSWLMYQEELSIFVKEILDEDE